MSSGKGANYTQQNEAVGFHDLSKGEPQAGVCFSWMGTCQGLRGISWLLETPAAIFHHNTARKKGKPTDHVIYEMLLLDISICDLKLSSNVGTPKSCSSCSH